MRVERALATLGVLLAGCGPARPYRVVIHHGSYADVQSNSRATFDYYRPVGDDEVLPAVLAIHGGAWSSGDKVWGQEVAAQLCPRGYGVVAINYRLAPEHRWPAQLEDCQAALDHVRANAAALALDPRRIGALGSSAGGHLAAMLALRGARPAACGVTASGEGDLTVHGAVPIMANEDALLGDLLGPGPWTEDALRDASPAAFARPGAAVLVAHAAGDPNVFYDQGARLHAALAHAGAVTDLVTASDAGHHDTWRDPPVMRRIAAFLRATLGGRLHRRTAGMLGAFPAGELRELAWDPDEALD